MTLGVMLGMWQPIAGAAPPRSRSQAPVSTHERLVVVGGGPVGAGAARMASRHGLHTTLLDARAGVPHRINLLGLNHMSVEVARDLGVRVGGTEDRSLPICRVAGDALPFHVRGLDWRTAPIERLVSLMFPSAEAEPIALARIHEMEVALRREFTNGARGNGASRLEQGTTFVGAELTDHGVRVRTMKSGARDGEEDVVDADRLILALGANNEALLHQLGVQVSEPQIDGREMPTQWAMVSLWPESETSRFGFDRQEVREEGAERLHVAALRHFRCTGVVSQLGVDLERRVMRAEHHLSDAALTGALETQHRRLAKEMGVPVDDMSPLVAPVLVPSKFARAQFMVPSQWRGRLWIMGDLYARTAVLATSGVNNGFLHLALFERMLPDLISAQARGDQSTVDRLIASANETAAAGALASWHRALALFDDPHAFATFDPLSINFSSKDVESVRPGRRQRQSRVRHRRSGRVGLNE